MSSPPSSSESAPDGSQRSSAFQLLHPRVQKWIWDQGWGAMREIQEQAIPAILGGEADVILAAATAGGKTEAAFLPLASLLTDVGRTGIRVLCISPLKALINDQFDRLSGLFDYLEVPVHRWHGDVSASSKRKLSKNPNGVLLITPESLEALFVIHGYHLGEILGGVERIVIDEVHVFISSERGKQLQSLLSRLEQRLDRRVLRIGLSATLGDTTVAQEYLRPGAGDGVLFLDASDDRQEIRIQVRGYVMSTASKSGADSLGGDDQGEPSASIAIAEHLWKVLRGNKHLVFANRRATVEQIADHLRRRSAADRVPNEFHPHHGSLSKELREETERKLKDPSMPATAICTSTLELGIDLGQVATVGQVNAPYSVASIRQRLGRSGRRGDAATLRMYVEEPPITSRSSLLDELRQEVVQSVAMIELLVEGWCEPNDAGGLSLSTLVQQILSLIAERGGVRANVAWTVLCELGAFRSVTKEQFVSLLRSLGKRDLIVQSEDGTLIHGEVGERVVEHFGFYAVFSSVEEFRLLHDGRVLGTLAFDTSLAVDILIVFAGRRWRVASVDLEAKNVYLMPSPGGRLPRFEGGRGGLVHDSVRLRMRSVWQSGASPRFLDEVGAQLLVEGRSCYTRAQLDDLPIRDEGGDAFLFLCRGDRVMNTVAVMLVARGHKVMCVGPMIQVRGLTAGELERELKSLLLAPPDPVELARTVENKAERKYDWALDDELLSADYATRALDGALAASALRELLSRY